MFAPQSFAPHSTCPSVEADELRVDPRRNPPFLVCSMEMRVPRFQQGRVVFGSNIFCRKKAALKQGSIGFRHHELASSGLDRNLHPEYPADFRRVHAGRVHNLFRFNGPCGRFHVDDPIALEGEACDPGVRKDLCASFLAFRRKARARAIGFTWPSSGE